ncbi:MAG TPA: CHAD domain-containing protein [Polyangiaceae bacterium]|nr:CHAD domain-containing protein [Polyangiaceae bacterium]
MNDALAPTVGPYLTGKLRKLDARLREVVPRVVAPTPDEDAVHDLRVALRRTRTVLEVGRTVFGRFYADQVRRALRDLQRATGALRDEEVLLDLVASLRASDPGIQAWLQIRHRRERGIRRALVRLIEAGELDRGRYLLEALLAFQVNPSRDRRLGRFARRAVARARRRVERRRAARTDDPLALHELRIATKRLRYVVDVFSEALPSDLAALAQPASRLQNLLGSVHDVDVVVDCVRRARSLPFESRRELLAALARLREERAVRYATEAGLLAEEVPGHASGTEALRKISTR